MIGDLHATDLLLDILPIEERDRPTYSRIVLERDLDLSDRCLKRLLVNLFLLEESVTKRIERDRPIHRARINIGITDRFGQVFRHSALSARRVAVDRYNNSSHISNRLKFYLAKIRNFTQFVPLARLFLGSLKVDYEGQKDTYVCVGLHVRMCESARTLVSADTYVRVSAHILLCPTGHPHDPFPTLDRPIHILMYTYINIM